MIKGPGFLLGKLKGEIMITNKDGIEIAIV